MRDNQNADLTAAKKHNAVKAAHRVDGEARMNASIENAKFAEWTQVDGVDVLRIEDSKFVAVPTTGRKTARKFDIIDIEANEYMCQMSKSEVYKWLQNAAI